MLGICAKKKKRRKEKERKKVDFTSALQRCCGTFVYWNMCLKCGRALLPMSELPMFFYEKTPKFDKVVNFWKVCFLKRHGKHFLYFAC